MQSAGRATLVAEDPDASYQWCQPPIAHIDWRSEPIVRHVIQWATVISQHRTDVRQVIFPAEFIPGGTIGPVRKG